MNILPAVIFGISFFSVFLVMASSSRSRARYYLSALVLTLAVPNVLNAFLGPHWEWRPWLRFLISLQFFYYGPLLYTFVRSITNKHRGWSMIDTVHFLIPLLVIPLVFTVQTVAGPVEEEILAPLFVFFQLISLISYSLVAYSKIDDFLPDPLIESGSRLKVQGHSLKVTILIFVISWATQALLEYIPIPSFMSLFIRGLFILTYTVAVCYIGVLYFAANREPLPGEPPLPASDVSPSSGNPGFNNEVTDDFNKGREGEGNASSKYVRSGLKAEDAARLMKEIEMIMESEKPYLDTDFSPQYLSQKLNAPVAYISQAINQECSTNFYGFVNGYRVQTVVSELEQKKNQPINLLHLALNAGFNSKSTFNQAFKKMTGFTPSEYKKQLLA